jgi:hypothetical protein
MDRYDEALAAATESTRRAQRARQGWTLRLFETRRGRLLGLLGLLADAAAALEGRFAPGDSAVADCPGRQERLSIFLPVGSARPGR